MGKFVIQPHVRLQEWVAEEHDYFRAEELDYEFQESMAGGSVTTSSVQTIDQAPPETKKGAFADMQKGRTCDVSAACHWAVNAASASSYGKMWGKAYSVSPSGIFVAPASTIQKPEELAGVEVGVGYQSGSHYSAIQGLEPFLGRDAINLRFVGVPNDRARLMLARKLPAANVFGAHYYILEQHGFRKIVDTTFMIGFLVAENADQEDVAKYFRALQRAQRDIDLEPERYKHYWLRELAQDLKEIVDVRRFGPGERLVFEPYTREMFERAQRWMRT